MIERVMSSHRAVKRWMWWVLVAVAVATALWVYFLLSHYRAQDWGGPRIPDRNPQPSAERMLSTPRINPSAP